MELHIFAIAGDEDSAQLGSVHAVGKTGSKERTGADPDIAIHAGEIQSIASFIQCAQCAQFVHRADGAAAGDGQPDAGLACTWFGCVRGVQ